MIYTRITARVRDSPDHFFIDPNGMLFGRSPPPRCSRSAWRATSYKPDLPYGLHPAGFTIHSGIYRARPDARSIMHSHTVAGMAVSALKCGLLPLTQRATRFYGRVSYRDFHGPERGPAQRDALARSLGGDDYMILRSHGLLTLGESVPEAFIAVWGMERSCQGSCKPWPATPS